ncbi:B3 domain-containing protein At1g49475-like [Arachis ipaensis]|nr:B3 domain-containing protein At1g49475-like [Arachis ipaensis]
MCEGLPLGINVMARLMKGINDDINIWKYTQSKLEDSSMGEDMEKEVIKVLKRSYDHLADKTIQNCFLQHALYSDVSPEVFIMNLVDEGLIQSTSSLEKIFVQGEAILAKLSSHSLISRKLPTEFTNKYGLKLPNPVILKVVNGNQKKVHWTNINGSIWFIGKEWKEFLEHYSVSHGHLLLFKYCLDASYFRVQIFYNTTLEIDYPSPELNYADYDDDDFDFDDDGDGDGDGDDDVMKVHYDQYQF